MDNLDVRLFPVENEALLTCNFTFHVFKKIETTMRSNCMSKAQATGFSGTDSRNNRNLADIFGAKFAKKQSVKNGRFRGNFLAKFHQKSINFAPI